MEPKDAHVAMLKVQAVNMMLDDTAVIDNINVAHEILDEVHQTLSGDAIAEPVAAKELFEMAQDIANRFIKTGADNPAKPICDNCRFFSPRPYKLGRCRRYPPAVTLSATAPGHHDSTYPEITSDSFCGEHQPA